MKNDKPLFSQKFEAEKGAEIGKISAEMGDIDTDRQVLEQGVKGETVKVGEASLKTGNVKSRPAWHYIIVALLGSGGLGGAWLAFQGSNQEETPQPPPTEQTAPEGPTNDIPNEVYEEQYPPQDSVKN